MKRTVWSLALVPGLLITIAWPDPVQAQAAGRQCAGQVRSIATYRQEAVRMGVTPERVREVYAVVDCNLTRIRELAGRNGVQEATLVAVTRELGLRNNATAAQIIAAIDGLAGQVANLNREITALRAQLGTSAAQRAIVDIEARLASGDLDGAAAAFAALNATLRTDEGTSRTAFDSMFRAQAQLAFARGDVEEGGRITNVGIAGRAEQRRLRVQAQAESEDVDRREDLAAILIYARELENRGGFFGQLNDLNEALRLLTTIALPLAPREHTLSDWIEVQRRLGLLNLTMGRVSRNIEFTNRALAIFDSLILINPEDLSLQFFVATTNIAQFRVSDNFLYLERARLILEPLSQLRYQNRDMRFDLTVAVTLGELFGAIGAVQRDASLLRQSVNLLEGVNAALAEEQQGSNYQALSAYSDRELARSLFFLGTVTSNAEIFSRSREASARAQRHLTYESAPALWRDLEYIRAAALQALGGLGSGSLTMLQQAEIEFQALLQRTDSVSHPRIAAQINQALVNVRRTITAFAER